MTGNVMEVINNINKANGVQTYNTSCKHYCECDNEPYCAIKMDMLFCTENCAYFEKVKDTQSA